MRSGVMLVEGVQVFLSWEVNIAEVTGVDREWTTLHHLHFLAAVFLATLPDGAR